MEFSQLLAVLAFAVVKLAGKKFFFFGGGGGEKAVSRGFIPRTSSLQI